MEAQDVFNRVWNHFIVQEQPLSYVPNPLTSGAIVCRYRGDNGARCAAGLFIPDEAYTAAVEGRGVGNMPEADLCIFGEAGTHASLLADLQGAHDGAAGDTHRGQLSRTRSYSMLRDALETVAERYGLTVPSPL